MESDFKFLADETRRKVEAALQRAGLLCRVFARGKSRNSLTIKLENGDYAHGKKLLQDAIGVRVVLYFQEDIEIVEKILKANFVIDEKSSSIDLPEKDKFTVCRYNLVFKLPDSDQNEAKRIINSLPIDSTFEVQIRSVFSEGWHEVEHDLRYKCKEFWDQHDDLSRTLNGIMATLETSEWSMKSIFEDLAYRHYKDKKWVPMLVNRMRIRAQPIITQTLLTHFESPDFAKQMYRINREFVIKAFAENRIIAPTIDNAIYIWNLYIKANPKLIDDTPSAIKDAFNRWNETTQNLPINT